MTASARMYDNNDRFAGNLGYSFFPLHESYSAVVFIWLLALNLWATSK